MAAKQSELKSDALLELMKQHLSTDAGKELTKKIGLVYQINISPKVGPSTPDISHFISVFLAASQILFDCLLDVL